MLVSWENVFVTKGFRVDGTTSNAFSFRFGGRSGVCTTSPIFRGRSRYGENMGTIGGGDHVGIRGAVTNSRRGAGPGFLIRRSNSGMGCALFLRANTITYANSTRARTRTLRGVRFVNGGTGTTPVTITRIILSRGRRGRVEVSGLETLRRDNGSPFRVALTARARRSSSVGTGFRTLRGRSIIVTNEVVA